MQRDIDELVARGKATRQYCEEQIAEVRQQLEHVTAERDEARGELDKARDRIVDLETEQGELHRELARLREQTKPAPPADATPTPITP